MENKVKYEPIVEEIHHKFKIAVDEIKLFVKTQQELLANSNFKIDKNTYAEDLKSLGFDNIKSVIEYDEHKNKIENKIAEKEGSERNATSILNLINFYKDKYPLYNIIFLPQIINICEKYDLYFGSSKIYNGEIPKRNLEAIKQFDKIKSHKHFAYFNSYRTHYSQDKPLSSLVFRGQSNYDSQRLSEYFICAPKDNYIKETGTVGCEIFKYKKPKLTFELKRKPKVLDPIVLFPVDSTRFGFNAPAFLIITAWGPEASDPLITNQKHN